MSRIVILDTQGRLSIAGIAVLDFKHEMFFYISDISLVNWDLCRRFVALRVLFFRASFVAVMTSLSRGNHG